MVRLGISLVLTLSIAVAIVAPAAAQSVQKRPAKLPSGVALMRVSVCQPESPKDALCTSSRAMVSRIARFVYENNEDQPSKTRSITIAPYQAMKTGNILWGASYYDRRKQQMWLVEPRWAELHLLDADYALGRAPGTQTWQRIDTLTGKAVPIGDGGGGTIPRLLASWGTYQALNRAFLTRNADDGSATLVVLSPEGMPTNVTINRVVPTEKLPKGRVPIEQLDDGTLLVHRLDEKGRVFDQIFNAEATVAMTPPMPPLVMVDYDNRRRFMLLEIDRERRLFWPVRGSDVLSKPPGIIGMRPVSGRFTSLLEPVSAAEQQALYTSVAGDPSPYAAQMPRCLVGRRGCDLSRVWTVAWQEADGVRLALVGDSKEADNYWLYDLPSFKEIAGSGAAADYTLVRNVTERPETARSAMVAGGGAVTRIDSLLIAGRADGRFDFLAHGGVMEPKGRLVFDLKNLALVPLANESQAVTYTSKVMDNMREHEREAWRIAQEQVQEAARNLREKRAREAAQAKNLISQRFESAFARRDWSVAIPAAWRYTNDAVYRATIAALKSNGGGYIGYAEIQLAENFATPAEKSLLTGHAARLNEEAERSQQRFASPQSAASNGPSASSPTPYVDTSAADMSNRIFNSRMDYLEGKTSGYLCGSASFCR